MKSAQLSILFLISISRCIDDYLKLCHGHPYFRDSYSVTSIPSTTIWFVLSRRLTLGRDKLTYYCTMGGIPLFVLVPTYVRTCTNLQWAESSFLWSKYRQSQETCHKVYPHTVNWFLHSDIPFDQFWLLFQLCQRVLIAKDRNSYCNIVLVQAEMKCHSYLMVFKIHDEFYKI